MKTEFWFPTPIWIEKLTIEDEILHKAIQSCHELKKIHSGVEISNYGGWQSADVFGTELTHYTSQLQWIKDLRQVFIAKINECLSLVTPTTKEKLIVTNAWININSKGHFNGSHIHPSSVFSGVFYLTDGSDILFEKPYDPMTFWLKNIIAANEDSYVSSLGTKYTPSPKTLLIFPSYLPHSVEPSTTDSDRISIAFNTQLLSLYNG